MPVNFFDRDSEKEDQSDLPEDPVFVDDSAEVYGAPVVNYDERADARVNAGDMPGVHLGVRRSFEGSSLAHQALVEGGSRTVTLYGARTRGELEEDLAARAPDYSAVPHYTVVDGELPEEDLVVGEVSAAEL